MENKMKSARAAGPESESQELSPQEQMIHRRAVEAAVWGMPLEGTRGFLIATRTDLGGDWNDVVYFSKPMVSRHGFLTANNQTPYVIASLNTKDGPLVVEVPGASDKAKYFGSFVDAWDYPFADVGPAGADEGEGGKYLFLPPGYEGEVPEGYLVFRPNTYAVYAALRPVAEKGATIEEQVAYARTLKVYRLSEASNPPPTNFIDAYPKKWDTLPNYDISFFHDLADAINEEPVLERDLAMMGILSAIGIEKGKPFNPDERTQQILELAIKDAYDYMQDIFVNRAFRNFVEGTSWSVFDLSIEQAKAGWPFVTEDRMLIDERANLYHYATFMPKVLGGGSFYLTNLYDSEGRLFDGESIYKMNVPADTPAEDFWSAIAYSFATHGFIVGSERVGISSLDKDSLKVNDDGSVDLYFAPSAPAGQESNWIPTGEEFWVALRLYGPKKPLFDKSWKLPNIENIK
ncbi:MAG: DUF1254 domain-containing protein [Candidatus Promineifilaceae bacterium]